MNLYAVIKKTDYRFWFIVAILTATISGILFEGILFRLSPISWDVLLIEYEELFTQNTINKIDLIRYVIVNDMKRILIIMLLQFTVLGLPYALYQCFVVHYRYIFLLFAMSRCHFGSKYIFCISAFVLCFVFYVPVFLCVMKRALRSFLYCNDNNVRFYRCTKYQLQTEVKIGIIILIYRAIGSVIESVVCTDLFARLFR